MHLYFDTSFYFPFNEEEKNKGAELVILLATKLDFPREKAVSKKLLERSKTVPRKGTDEPTQEGENLRPHGRRPAKPLAGLEAKGVLGTPAGKIWPAR